MTDIFISYARPDQEVARTLAHDLKSRGFEVWWDIELVGSDDFTDAIQAALSSAKCAIVIWSKASVRSRHVRDEARFALDQGKLIATRTAELDVQLIPLGFRGQHTDLVGSREQIVKAVQKVVDRPKDHKDPVKTDDQREYENAYALFTARHYAAAAAAFGEFVERFEYQDSPVRGAAHFWWGEAHYLNGNFLEARQAFGIGWVRYPREALSPKMVLRQAMSAARMGRLDEARRVLDILEHKYPDADADVKKLIAEERERLRWL